MPLKSSWTSGSLSPSQRPAPAPAPQELPEQLLPLPHQSPARPCHGQSSGPCGGYSRGGMEGGMEVPRPRTPCSEQTPTLCHHQALPWAHSWERRRGWGPGGLDVSSGGHAVQVRSAKGISGG